LRIIFVIGRSRIKEDLPSYYDPESETAYIFLKTIAERFSGDKLINAVIRCIIHESLHHAFKVCLGRADSKRIDKEHWAMKVIGQY